MDCNLCDKNAECPGLIDCIHGNPLFHEVDSYVHWQDKNRDETRMKLRAVYDKIILAGIPVEELDDLLSTISESGYDNGVDSCNPDL